MKMRLLVEYDPECRRWTASFPELAGCATAGDRETEVITNAREALALWFEPVELKLSSNSKLVELAIECASVFQGLTTKR